MFELNANSVDPDQTPRSAASYLGLYCLPMYLYGMLCINRLNKAVFLYIFFLFVVVVCFFVVVVFCVFLLLFLFCFFVFFKQKQRSLLK